MAAENRFVPISFNGIEGILKDYAITQKCSKKVVKLFDNHNLFYNLFDNLKLMSYIATNYKQRATNCNFQVCLLKLHDHKQQLTFLQRFKLIGLYPA